MKSFLNTLTLYFEALPDRLRNKKIIIWPFFIVITIFLVVGMFTQTKFDMTIESWFSDNDPMKVALDKFHAEFGSDDGVYIVYKPKDGNVFSAASLKSVHGIREDLLNYRKRLKKGEKSILDHIVRINTIVNAPILKADNDVLLSKKLVGNVIPTSQEELDAIRKTAESQKTFPLLYFSKDAQYGGIFIETDFGTIPLEKDKGEDEFGKEEEENDDMTMTFDESAVEERIRFKPVDMNEYLELMKEINAVLYNPKYAEHLKYYPIGNAPLIEYSLKIMTELGPLYGGTILIIILLLWLLFRSFSAVLWPVFIVIFSSIWVIGITGWLGITITTMLMLTLMLIVAIGTADAVHILSGYLFFKNHGKNHEQALRAVFKKSGLACMLTTITTMIAMLAVTFTPIVNMKVFGFMSAGGVLLAFILTILLLPLMLDLWSPTAKKAETAMKKSKHPIGRFVPNYSLIIQRFLTKVLPVVEKNPLGISLIFLVIFGFCVAGALQVSIDSNMIEQFKKGSSIRKTYEVVDKNMMGSQNMEIFIDMGKENALQVPMVLKELDRLQQTINTSYNDLVVKTSSLADVVKDAYQTLNEGREDMYIIPDDQKMLSQTLFLFNNANPEDRRKLVSDDYRKSHISLQLYNTGSIEYIKMFVRMNQDINATFGKLKSDYPDLKVNITGGLALIMELSDYISWSTIKAFLLVLCVISIILIFIFGSFRAGLISIIPNLIPSALTFGLMGWLDVPLDMDTMVIAPIIIGIAVDDTIHFITHYRGEILVDGNIARALSDTIKEVGQAITFTSLVLGLGFSVMSLSSHMGTANMGRFGCLAIFVALICDLFLLPAMILIFKPKFQAKVIPSPARVLNEDN